MSPMRINVYGDGLLRFPADAAAAARATRRADAAFGDLLSRVATLESQLKNARKKTGQAGGGGGAHARGAGTKPARGRKVALPPLVAMAVEAAC